MDQLKETQKDCRDRRRLGRKAHEWVKKRLDDWIVGWKDESKDRDRRTEEQ